MKIFLLEDDPIYVEIIKTDLKKMGHDIDTWGYFEEAKEKILQGKYDLLIIDIMLPKNSDEPGNEVRDGGIKVLESLASEKGYMIPATVFVSVYGYEDNKERIDILNLNKHIPRHIKSYFRKPYNINVFLATIKELGDYLASK